MALRAADVVRHVIGRGLGLTGSGIMLGLLGAYTGRRCAPSERPKRPPPHKEAT